jgi:fermentation-respiration switch protein FrsA (DUF1100 family)
MRRDDVSFPSDGLRLAGVLRRPEGSGPTPGVVLTGPFTGVKEQVAGQYAERLTDRGFATLVFDHRGFGDSEGLPRQHEDSAGKLQDLLDATSFLAAAEGVDPDRLGCVGICLGGGYAVRHAAFDPRVRALVTIAGAYNDPRAMRDGMGHEAYAAQLSEAASLLQRQHDTGQVDYMPAVAPEGQPAAMGGQEPFDYYGTERGRGGRWENRVTRLSIRSLLTFDAAGAADFLDATPVCVIHGRTDEYCSPAGAQALHDRVAGPKDLLWLDTTNHIDLYDVPDYVEPAVDRAASWLREHMGDRHAREPVTTPVA